MALRFVFGGSGSGKSEYVKNLAIELAIKDRANTVLMIVPDQFTMQTQWAMANSHPDGGIINIDVLSFSRLPRKVFEEVGQPKRIMLDDTGKCLLIKRGALKVKDNLHVLSRGMENAGWSGEVKSVISEFMQYDISAEKLDEIKEKCESSALKLKLSDLKLLYEAFLKECEGRYLTGEGLLDLFVERLPLSKKMTYSTVIFDGFTGFTPIQIKAIGSILNIAKDVIITFPFDNDTNADPYVIDESNYLFDLTKRNVKDILKICETYGINVLKEVRLTTDYRHQNSTELAFLEKNIFRKGNGRCTNNGTVSINACADVDSECHLFCEALINEIKQKNYRYRDMAVICADMEKYRKPLAKYLERYHIPYYMDANRNINNNPLVKFILSITEILKNNFKQDDVLKLLRTGIAPFEDEEIDSLENYIHARGIKGANRWKNEFLYLSKEQKDNKENLEEMNALRTRFMGMFEEITRNGTRARKLSVWIEQIYNILETAEVDEKLEEISARLKENEMNAEAMEYEGIYNKVIELFDALNDLMGDENFTVKEFNDILKVGFSEIRIGVLPQSVDSLLVGDMQRTRLKETKALFILGVNDGNIPKTGNSGGLLSVPDKEELKKAECRLAPTSDELAFIEQLYIYLNLTKPTERLYLSYAGIGTNGESLLPSYLIEVLTNMFEGLKVSDLTKRRPRLFIQDIKEEAGRLLGLYVTGLLERDKEDLLFEDLGIIRGTENGKEWCEKVINNSFKEYSPVPIESETAKELYGSLLMVSVSTLEQFAKCRYAYFVKDGLKLEEREEYGLESVDMGNLSHDVLEKVGAKLKESGQDFSNADQEMMEREIDLAIEKLVNDYKGDLLTSDEKTKYYAVQLSRIMKRTVKTLGYQLSKGSYRPEMLEEKFRKKYDSHNVVLEGRIDRTDVYDDETGNEYVKVIDYKSSEHKINREALEEGLSIQLAIYMKNAVEILKERYPDKNVLPAAMLYYAIDDPFAKKGKENPEEEIIKALRPTGAVINDDIILGSLDPVLLNAKGKSDVVRVTKKADNTPDEYSITYSEEEFVSMLDKAEGKALELSDDILAGSIDVNPVKEKKKTACEYCPLKGACGFDEKIKGYEFRTVGKDSGEAEDDDEDEEDE